MIMHRPFRSTRAGVAIWIILILIATQFIPPKIASAGDEIPPVPVNPPQVQITETDGATITIVSQTAKVSQPYSKGGIAPDSASFQVGSHWVEYANCWGHLGSLTTWHCYARTKKLSGSGSYKTHAHAAFIEGDSGGVEYGDPIVFSIGTHGCAWVE
jgi:hypothetical protein